ncbi:hypothetical protein [Halopiger goleimassiliensis]|uniref:hypothetical protein n=1 Tax=Halopiger goleimassiliensis TaxID=1293048 RepID=UPI0012B5DECB|nr:hypothetical protein [Halopiger goleimassiliensis]
MTSEGVIASDATKNDFHDQHPHGFSAISVAIAIEDQSKFNQEYFDIISDKIDKYGMKTPTPIIKDKYINRYVPLWQQEEARIDIVLELLSIDVLDTIYVTETYFQPFWIELYGEEDGKYRREISHDFVEDVLFQYYDIISIWKYLDRYNNGGSAYTNVMTDDFSGNVSKAYEEIGEYCDRFDAIPYGDITYPALSMADLVTGLLKQEVYPLRREEIQEFIQDDTPAYVETERVHKDDLNKIVPHKTENVRTDLLRPDPTIHIHKGNMEKKRLFTLDVFKFACAYAQQNGGCVKLFDESNDRHHLSGRDLIICLNNTSDDFIDYEELNSKYSAKVLDRSETLNFLTDNIDPQLIL